MRTNKAATAPTHCPMDKGVSTTSTATALAQRLTPVRAAGRYEGEWRDGKRNGHGTLTLPDGRRCAYPAWRRGVAGGD